VTCSAPTRISVVVPTRNRCALLDQALTSVRAITADDLELQIIVADDGSTDGTPAVVRAHGATAVAVGRRGAAAARNAALSAATGEFIAFLDDDDAWLPANVRSQLTLLQVRPELAAAIGQSMNTDATMLSRGAPWPSALPADGDLFESFLYFCPQIGATVVRSSVLASVGGFDETLAADEDWDWHLRLACTHAVGFVPVPCLLFRQRRRDNDGDLNWQRLAYNRKVFGRAVLTAGRQRPSPPSVIRAYSHHVGTFYGYFIHAGQAHAQSGDSRSALLSVYRAAYASPLHAVAGFARPGGVGRILATVSAGRVRQLRRRPSILAGVPSIVQRSQNSD